MAKVCYVDAKGQVICVDEIDDQLSLDTNDAAWMARHLAARANVAPEQVPPAYWELGLKVLKVIGESMGNVPPNELAYRTEEILGAVRMLLRKGDPPSMLAFQFDTQPGDVFGAYNLNKAELVYMHRTLEHFKTPKPLPKPSAGAEGA
jgi:hypothetical protein